MILRILGEGQFALPEADVPALQELDVALEAAVDSDDDARFRSALSALLGFVRTKGAPLPDDQLEASDAILPDEDAHVDEVRALLMDDGVIPG